MISQEELAAIQAAPLHVRMRWFAEMNAWGTPPEFPAKLPTFSEVDTASRYRNPIWWSAFGAVSDSITYPESSLGWWLYAIGKTAEDWRTWWVSRKSGTNQDRVAEANTTITAWRLSTEEQK